MKSIICLLSCIAFIHSICGQEITKPPERTPEQKLLNEIYSQWDIISSAISFTKTHGVSAYEYGKYTGDLFASSWNKENSFAYYSNDIVFNWENWRTKEDAAVFIISKSDESLVFKVSLNGLKIYFGEEGNYGVSFDEMMQCIIGIEEQIAKYLGCIFAIEIGEEYDSCSTSWYLFATITITKNDLTG